MKNQKGFTLIELLLVMIIIGILAGIIFVSLGNQRKKAKLNAVMQTAKGNHAISMECYFRVGKINQPNDKEKPTNEICLGSKTIWMPIAVSECGYEISNSDDDPYYEINCPDFEKKIRCGIKSGGECEELEITGE